MLPLNNLNLFKYYEKMKKSQLTIENILEEEDIIQDLKVNENSLFLNMLSNEAIRKLIDYATKMQYVDDQKLCHKYAFNATEILIANNAVIRERIMNEIELCEEQEESKENEEEKNNEEKKEENKESGNQNKNNDEEKRLHKYKNNEQKYDEKDNNKVFEENEDSENSEISDSSNNFKTVIIYDNIDHLLGFLKEPKKTVSNFVLVGYFSKILNHLIISESTSSKIVQYIFDYPFKNNFNLLDAFVQNLNRKSIGSIIKNLLLYYKEGIQFEIKEQKLILIKKMLKELEKTDEKDKYECICEVFCSTLTKRSFYALFISNNEIVELLFSLLEKSIVNSKKLISIIKILIKVNENVLENFSTHCTKNLIPSINTFNYEFSFPVNKNQNSFSAQTSYEESINNETLDFLHEEQITDEEMEEINNKVLLSLLNTLKKNKLKVLEDLGEYNQDNKEFKTTYLRNQKKIGMKKLVQIEFLRTILDIFVNAFNVNANRGQIIELIDMMKNKNIFYICHKLFFNFPDSNIYQIFYDQIFDIALNISSPKNLVEYFCKYTDEKKAERNIVKDLMDNFFNKMKFTFSDWKNSFGLNVPFDVTLLNKIVTSENENVKKLFENDNDLKVFNEVIGNQINNIFNQKLLLPDYIGTSMNDKDDEKPLPTFGKLNFMEIVDEDTEIYNLYKKGEYYKSKFNEKLEREKLEKEIIENDEEYYSDNSEENEKEEQNKNIQLIQNNNKKNLEEKNKFDELNNKYKQLINENKKVIEENDKLKQKISELEEENKQCQILKNEFVKLNNNKKKSIEEKNKFDELQKELKKFKDEKNKIVEEKNNIEFEKKNLNNYIRYIVLNYPQYSLSY